jgi:hypothetical protein
VVSGGDAAQVTDSTFFEFLDGAYTRYGQTMLTPSPLWSLPTSGGVPGKVLEGIVPGNFVIEGGITSI